MSTAPIISEVFARAWTLADDLDDAQAQDRLAELRRQSLALPFSRQEHILGEVTALTERLRRRWDEGGGENERRGQWA